MCLINFHIAVSTYVCVTGAWCVTLWFVEQDAAEQPVPADWQVAQPHGEESGDRGPATGPLRHVQTAADTLHPG